MIDRDMPWGLSLPHVSDVFPEITCPHGRFGGCWACADETNPHAGFAQDLFDASQAISEAIDAGKNRDDDFETGFETPSQARLARFEPGPDGFS